MRRELLGVQWDIPRVLLAALVMATLVALVYAAGTSAAAFGLYNPSWEGGSELRSIADETGVRTDIVRNASWYDGAGDDGVAVVLAPNQEYTERELESIRGFLYRGGTLVVAEDVGMTGNELLAGVGASARVNGTLLRDERYNYRSPTMPVARNVTANGTFTQGVDKLTLNYASTVDRKDEDVSVLVRSSEFAYLDRNGNSELDQSERTASRPVVTVEPIREGQVVVVSDPSIFINAMQERPGNRRFARNIVGSGDRLLLDFSHSADLPPLAVLLLTIRRSGLLQALLLGVGATMITAWGAGLFGRLSTLFSSVRRRRVSGVEGPVSETELMTYLQRKHPEWDTERLTQVVQGLNTEDPESEQDQKP